MDLVLRIAPETSVADMADRRSSVFDDGGREHTSHAVPLRSRGAEAINLIVRDGDGLSYAVGNWARFAFETFAHHRQRHIRGLAAGGLHLLDVGVAALERLRPVGRAALHVDPDTDCYRVVLFVDFMRPLRWPLSVLNKWIMNLAVLAPFLREAKGKAKLVGLCFGHQIMAQAFGGRVEKSERGWGLGLHGQAEERERLAA